MGVPDVLLGRHQTVAACVLEVAGEAVRPAGYFVDPLQGVGVALGVVEPEIAQLASQQGQLALVLLLHAPELAAHILHLRAELVDSGVVAVDYLAQLLQLLLVAAVLLVQVCQVVELDLLDQLGHFGGNY